LHIYLFKIHAKYFIKVYFTFAILALSELILCYLPCSKSKLLEEYLTIYPDLSSSHSFDYIKYKESIQPLVTIAHNNGFMYL